MTETAPPIIAELVTRFAEHAEAYRAGRYNETQLRREFVDPLFRALGWDVDNSAGYAEAYKDVIHEDAIKIGGATKAPDYCFRIGGARKFFVEAKKPSVDIKGDPGPAYQLRRYAWSAKLPLSILTDFAELAVYDCRVKPAATDKAGTARTLYVRCEEYPARWDEIASVFSREAVLKGSFDKYAESIGRKRGTSEVDDSFLAEIEQWRDSLAHSFALRNPDLTQRDLNFAVQRTIDRIVFLRICEDRGVEPYGTLQGLIGGANVYQRLFERFRRADERYNSGLFHFSDEKGRTEAPDDLTPGLALDDKPLTDILARLYYPESPYEFSVLPVDILGQVYEQFLGKVIRLTAGHQARVEEKPEVRKAGGVYYTPTYIVDYIVKHTVGELVEGKTPQEVGGLAAAFQPSKAKGVRPLAVLDPACGSGSFLLGAYQFLLDWYRDWYVADGPEKHAAGRNPRLYQRTAASPSKGEGRGEGEWRLTTAERKRILLAHIYGVDIDSQAVETTKLSLLLKVLEGETAEHLDAGLRLFHERALPDLAGNIKCGNSLIGPDFYNGRQLTMFDEEQRYRINVFDWNAEFKDIVQGGGFDAVIGNPPYYKVSGKTQREQFDYLRTRYVAASYKIELYALFAERALSLLAANGLQSFIVPNSFLAGVYLRPVRRLLATDNELCELIMLPNIRVFQAAKLDSVVYVARKRPATPGHHFVLRLTDETMVSSPDQVQLVHAETWSKTPGLEFRITQGSFSAKLLERVQKAACPLRDVATVHLGLVLASNSLLSPRSKRTTPDPILLGRDIGRYGSATVRRWFSFRRDPIVGGTKNPDVYACGPRLAFQAIRNLRLPRRLVGTMIDAGVYTMGTVHNIIVRDKRYSAWYVLGLLNSQLLNAVYASQFPEHRIKGRYLESLPIARVDFEDKNSKGQHDHMVSLARNMLDLHKRLAAAKTPHGKTVIQRQIDATDRQIDRLVYELYGLTDEEIRIVEEAT